MIYVDSNINIVMLYNLLAHVSNLANRRHFPAAFG